jgi:hypothetical protein
MRSSEHQSVPDTVDIRDLRGEYCDPPTQTITGETLEVQGRPLHVEVRAVVYHPTIKNWLDGGSVEPSGSRTVFGIFLSSGTAGQLIQLVRGPSEFSVSTNDDNWQLVQEKKILEAVGEHPPVSFVVAPLPRAHQTNERIYESTAPGILLSDALSIVADAYGRGELTAKEVALILRKMHSSVHQSLAQLHSLGIKHHHAHASPGNFNVDIRTANATVFDYTLAVSRDRPDTFMEVDHPVRKLLTADDLEEDIQTFELSWQQALAAAELSTTPLEDSDTQAMDAAIAQLEPAVIRAALRSIGFSGVSDNDVQSIIAAQEIVIGKAPDIFYPKNTANQRLKTRFALARRAIEEFIFW